MGHASEPDNINPQDVEYNVSYNSTYYSLYWNNRKY